MKNCLLTGCAGFIGSNFVNYMAKKYHDTQFVVLDILDYCASLENIDKNANVEVIIGDIANKELVRYILEKFQIDTVAHIAAQSSVDNSFYNSIAFTQTNVLGTHILLETIRIYHEKTGNINKIFYVSTDEVYGENLNDKAMTETAIYAPSNVYSATKAASELIIMAYRQSYKLPILCSRGNNVYGKNQYPEKVVAKFICKLLNNEKLTIHGNGSSRRNFIHVDDTCTAFETILMKGEIGEIYNISSAEHNEFNVMQIVEMLVELIHPGEELDKYIEYVEDRKFNDSRYYISSEKLEKLGWKPVKTNFVEELKELIEWYRVNKGRYGF